MKRIPFILIFLFIFIIESTAAFSQSLNPSITNFSPTNGTEGTNVIITGTNFTGVTDVRFNQTSVGKSFTVDSVTQITTSVPQGATSGKISVITENGTAISDNSFTIAQSLVPKIDSFSPSKGPIGIKIAIIGKNFKGATEVSFNSQKTDFVVTSSTKIMAVVPPKAMDGPIKIVTPNGAVSSSTEFKVRENVGCKSSVSVDRWKGVYFEKNNLNGRKLMTRDDEQLDGFLRFNWKGSPSIDCGIPVNNFSVQWTKTVTLPSGRYQFKITADDGIRVYIDSKRILNRWIDQGATTYFVEEDLASGNHDLLVEYYQKTGAAIAEVSWTTIPPIITDFSPKSGPRNTIVTIKGKNLGGVKEIYFNKTKATDILTNSGSKITVIVPPKATSGRIKLSTGDHTVTTSNSFIIVDPAVNEINEDVDF